MIIAISGEYLGPMERISRGLSFDFVGFGSVDKAMEMFHLTNPSRVIGYVYIQDYMDKKELVSLLDKVLLRVCDNYKPTVILATKDPDGVLGVCRTEKYKSLDIGLTGYELMSEGLIKNIYGDLFIEHFDVFEGRIKINEPIKREPLPRLETENLLSNSLKKVFSDIEITPTYTDILEIDSPLKDLKKISPVLEHLRIAVLAKSFDIVVTDDEFLDSLNSLLDSNIKIEYAIIHKFIKEDFNAKILRRHGTKIETFSYT